MTLDDLVKAALEEDVGGGDVTTQWTIDPSLSGIARVLSRSEGVVSGLEPFSLVFRQLNRSIVIRSSIKDGDRITPDEIICELSGPFAAILTGERTALNFLGRLSGIATLTRRFVDQVQGSKAVILDTRKTTPLWRELEKAAVRHGGGENHRQGLYDMILVKDNHEAAAGGITAALSKVFEGLKRSERPIPVEVEVQNLEQIDEVLNFKVDRILLDNFNLAMIEEAVANVAGRVALEVSGGVTLQNVRRIAETGVNFISIGALTHSAPSLDFTLLLVR